MLAITQGQLLQGERVIAPPRTQKRRRRYDWRGGAERLLEACSSGGGGGRGKHTPYPMYLLCLHVNRAISWWNMSACGVRHFACGSISCEAFA